MIEQTQVIRSFPLSKLQIYYVEWYTWHYLNINHQMALTNIFEIGCKQLKWSSNYHNMTDINRKFTHQQLIA